MKTAIQWFESVKEDQTREILLRMTVNDKKRTYDNLAEAILFGFLWPSDVYWIDLHERAEQDNIETIN